MQRDFDRLREGPFDLLVVGGGIYGAWVALDGALRGLKVALVERRDWAAGTSSASSKLIHGGLRYLQHLRLRSVQKSLLERKQLTRLVPHQIRPLRFLLPTYRGHPGGRVMTAVGLSVYDFLAGGDQPVEGYQSLSREEVVQDFPSLHADNLVGGFLYGDCGTDDARFTVEVVDAAWRAGVAAVNHAPAVELMRARGRCVGAVVEDGESGATVEVEATVTVNTAGPWAEALFSGRAADERTMSRLTKGVHLVMPSLPCDHAFLLLARSDGRVFFLIPWYGKTLVGTTDTDYLGDPDDLAVGGDDVDYLLAELAEYVPGLGWDESSILGRFAGLRTLRNTDGVGPSSINREWQLVEPLEGLLMPVGGKFTSARVDGSQVAERVMAMLGRPVEGCPTDDRPLPWAPHEPFVPWQEQAKGEGVTAGLDEEVAHWSTHRFGNRVTDLHELLCNAPNLARRLADGAPFCRGEVVLAARDEMARTLEDALRRRMPLTLLAEVDRETLVEAADLMGDELGWSADRRRREVATIQGPRTP